MADPTLGTQDQSAGQKYIFGPSPVGGSQEQLNYDGLLPS